MTNLILFGAGASYGSDKNNTPPLGDALLHALRAFDPNGWGALPVDLQSQFNGDFERGMTTLAQQYPHATPPLQRTMAAYFFNFVPNQSNTYIDLAKRIKKSSWFGSFATLNYERLLELSIGSVGLIPVVGRETTPGNSVELCLPHGCCHLFCDSVQGRSDAVSFAGMDVTTHGTVCVIRDPIAFRERIQGDAFPPVMCYFEPRKRTTSGDNFIQLQRDRWKSLVTSANRIAIIGVRVRPNDSHIWNPLAETQAKIVYCSGASAASEFRRWAQEFRPSDSDIALDAYFADALDDICHEIHI